MKISTDKKELLRVLNACEKVSDKRSLLPVLSNVLLSAKDGALRVFATDTVVSMAGGCEADVKTAGSVCLHARELRDRVKAMPEGKIAIETSAGGTAKISAAEGPRRFSLHGTPGEDYPPAKGPEDGQTFKLSTKTVSELLARTAFAISTDDTRPHINSLRLELSGSSAIAVATDGHRLALANSQDVADDVPSVELLIPLKSVSELQSLIASQGGAEIEVSLLPDWVFFTVGGMTLGAKKIDAVFPPYNQVIPKGVDRKVLVTRRAFAEAVQAVQIAASARLGGVKLKLEPNALQVSAGSADAGDAFDSIECTATHASEAIGLNAKYLLDIFGAIDDHQIELGLSGELDPVVVRIPDDDSFVAVVMPMRI